MRACGGVAEATEAPSEVVQEAGARSWEMGGGGQEKGFRGSYRRPLGHPTQFPASLMPKYAR